jgi:hypothetical protein
MNETSATGGAALSSGELHGRVQKNIAHVMHATAELRARKLRRDAEGVIEVLRARDANEISWADRALRFMFGREIAPIVEKYTEVEDYGVIANQVVTNAGVAALANAFLNTFEPENFNFHGSGTGAVAEAVGDTALGTEVESRATGTQSSPAGGQYRTIGTVAYTATRAVTEHGIFSASSAGTLLDRSVFTAINVVNGDSIQFTYTLTLSAGG